MALQIIEVLMERIKNDMERKSKTEDISFAGKCFHCLNQILQTELIKVVSRNSDRVMEIFDDFLFKNFDRVGKHSLQP